MQGHNITIASPDKDMKPPKGVHYIHFEEVYSEKHIEQRKKLFEYKQMNPLTLAANYYTRQYDVCKGIQLDKKSFLMRPKKRFALAAPEFKLNVKTMSKRMLCHQSY